MNVRIEKSIAQGKITAPPSKSLAHRYIICAALSDGTSTISNVDMSEDIKATLDCIRTMGAKVTVDKTTVVINGIGSLENDKNNDLIFKCRESGSTMRFFMGLAMYLGNKSYFYGSETLRKRPFGIYEEICKNQGIEFTREEDRILIEGQLNPGRYEIKGNISSQFITGLLFSLPMFDDDSTIHLIEPIESRSYIDLTLQALKYFGVSVVWANDTDLYIKGSQKYKPMDISVEGDCSNAAFLDAFNMIDGKVEVQGVNPDTLQGDRVYYELFRQLASPDMILIDDSAVADANIRKNHTIDISDCPDLGPVLFAVAAANKGGIFTGTRRLKIKESDRGTVMCSELKKFGINSSIEENDIVIYGSDKPAVPEVILDGHNDHRIVMSEAILLSITGGEIEGAQAVTKSYPGFFEDIKSLGIKVSELS